MNQIEKDPIGPHHPDGAQCPCYMHQTSKARFNRPRPIISRVLVSRVLVSRVLVSRVLARAWLILVLVVTSPTPVGTAHAGAGTFASDAFLARAAIKTGCVDPDSICELLPIQDRASSWDMVSPSSSAQDSASAGRHKARSPAKRLPVPGTPYPVRAAGWGPQAGGGRFYSRWAEDWTPLRTSGEAPPLKAMPLFPGAHLTLSAEARLKHVTYGSEWLSPFDATHIGLARSVFGVSLRLHPALRFYSEVGAGQVMSRGSTSPPSFQNDASLQQLFVEARSFTGSTLLGVMVGRQEFSDGPRQLIALGGGPNLRRTWNGVRAYVHRAAFRVGAFLFRGTRFGRGIFDETVNPDERLEGVNASWIVSSARDGSNIYFDPFWMHIERPDVRFGGDEGLDDRHTIGVRLWGRRGKLNVDWMVSRQYGQFAQQKIDAWGVFTAQSLALSTWRWEPRLRMRLDLASGDGSRFDGRLQTFYPRYGSSASFSRGLFLSGSNLALVSPGFSASPTEQTVVTMEYGFARRLSETDAAYAGLVRPYEGTHHVSGSVTGRLLRASGKWTYGRRFGVSVAYEHFVAGGVLERAMIPSGWYGHLSMSYRY